MRTMLVGLGILLAVTLAAPRRADADVSVAIGLPGFGLFVGAPYPPPVVYAPPVIYGPPVYYAPPAYYAPYHRRRYYAPHYAYGHGRHRGWYKHKKDD